VKKQVRDGSYWEIDKRLNDKESGREDKETIK